LIDRDVVAYNISNWHTDDWRQWLKVTSQSQAYTILLLLQILSGHKRSWLYLFCLVFS